MNRKFLLFLAIFLLAVSVRLFNPTFRSLWGDEAHSIFMARSFSISALIEDSHLPLYFLILNGWQKVMGLSEYNLRLLSILIGLFSLIAFFFFTKELINEKVAIFASYLFAISPLAIMHSHEVRMYGFLLLFSILSAWAIWRLLEKPSFIRYIFYVIFSCLLTLTHVYGVLFIAAEGIYLVITLFYGRKFKDISLIFLSQFFVYLIILPFYLPLFLHYLGTIVQGNSPDMPLSVFPGYLKFFLFFFTLSLGETIAPWNWKVVIPAGLVFGGLFLESLRGVKQQNISFLVTLNIVPILIASLFLPPTLPKYLIGCLPFYLALLGNGIVRMKRSSVRAAALLVLTIAVAISIINYFSLREYHNSNQIEPWREVAKLIKDNYQPGDIIVASKYFTAYRLLNYYLDGYPIYCLQQSNYTVPFLDHLKFPIFGSAKSYEDVLKALSKRIWLVTHILDDRTFPVGYVENLRKKIEEKYALAFERKYISYQETLVSRLPTERHKADAYRIVVSLYKKR